MRSQIGQSPQTSSPKEGHTPAAASPRYDRVDALRGFALIWMATFHFCFDLSNFHLMDANFYGDPLWTRQRTCILSLFLLCAGAGQAVATFQGQTWARFWRRWAQIVGCAMLVSLGSWFMFPQSYIYFGVLHGMAVMLILARLLATRGVVLGAFLRPALILLGVVLASLPQLISDPFFDTKWTDWTGLVTHKPITEDYVPLLPWLGVMLWGLAVTQWLLAKHPGWLHWASPEQGLEAGRRSGDNSGLAASVRRGLALLGRWSLTFYMVHQPILIGCLIAWMTLTGRPFSL